MAPRIALCATALSWTKTTKHGPTYRSDLEFPFTRNNTCWDCEQNRSRNNSFLGENDSIRGIEGKFSRDGLFARQAQPNLVLSDDDDKNWTQEEGGTRRVTKHCAMVKDCQTIAWKKTPEMEEVQHRNFFNGSSLLSSNGHTWSARISHNSRDLDSQRQLFAFANSQWMEESSNDYHLRLIFVRDVIVSGFRFQLKSSTSHSWKIARQ
jgi:hypothetical protein